MSQAATPEAIKAIFLEELAEVEIGTEAIPPSAHSAIMARAMSAAVGALRERTGEHLGPDQKARLAAIAWECMPGESEVETVRFLNEALPDFGVLEALRDELKVAIPNSLSDPIKLQIDAIHMEEAKAAGVTQFDLDLRALSAAWTGLLERTDSLLNEAQRVELQGLKGGPEDHIAIVRFLDQTLPDFGVLDALRAELKAAYARVVAEAAETTGDAEQAAEQPLEGDHGYYVFSRARAEGGGTEEPQPEGRPGSKRSWFRRRRGRG